MSPQPAPPARILALCAHPDDVEIYCLGLLLVLQSVGWEIGWAVATDGLAGLPAGADPQLRRREALAAGALFGVTPQLLGLRDGGLRGSRQDREAVAAAIAAFRPDVLVTHNREDYHPDHRVLARLAAEACPADTLLLEADTMLGDGFLPDFHVDITPFFDDKRRALHQHASQAAPAFQPRLDAWAAFRGLHCGVAKARYGEGYRSVVTAATRRKMRQLVNDLERAGQGA